jgi:acyl dehydratase
MMKVFPWEWVHHGTMDVRFLLPLRPGDTIRTHGELESKESTGKGMSLVFDVGCKNQHGETVARGTTTVGIDRNK